MSNRKVTDHLLEMVSEEIISPELLVTACLKYIYNNRKPTNHLLEMVEDGIIDPKLLVKACLKYMSKDEIMDMAVTNEFLEEENSDDDYNEEDSEEDNEEDNEEEVNFI